MEYIPTEQIKAYLLSTLSNNSQLIIGITSALVLLWSMRLAIRMAIRTVFLLFKLGGIALVLGLGLSLWQSNGDLSSISSAVSLLKGPVGSIWNGIMAAQAENRSAAGSSLKRARGSKKSTNSKSATDMFGDWIKDHVGSSQKSSSSSNKKRYNTRSQTKQQQQHQQTGDTILDKIPLLFENGETAEVVKNFVEKVAYVAKDFTGGGAEDEQKEGGSSFNSFIGSQIGNQVKNMFGKVVKDLWDREDDGNEGKKSHGGTKRR